VKTTTLKKLYSHRLASEPVRTKALTTLSVVFDAVIGIGMLATGLYLNSPWYIASASYYLTLGIVRAYLLKHLVTPLKTTASGSRSYRRAGLLLSMAGLAYFAANTAVYLFGHALSYTGFIPYGVAALAFTKATLAIIGILSARSSGNPIRIALRVTGLCDALVSMSVTQHALMSMVADADAANTSSIVGMGFATIIAICGLVMASRKPIQNKSDQTWSKEKETTNVSPSRRDTPNNTNETEKMI
jgi:hypothetical protein